MSIGDVMRGSSPVYECTLDLDLMEEIGYPREDVSPTKEGLPMLHQIRNRMNSITNEFL